jgi:lipoprotein Spr
MKRFSVVIVALATAGAFSLTSCSTPKGVRATASTISASHSFKGITLPQLKTPGVASLSLKTVSASITPTASDALVDPAAGTTLRAKFAAIMQVAPQLLTNNSLYRFIDSWLGTPYRLGGTTHKGIDCSAFVQQLYANVFSTSLVRTAIEQFGMAKRLFDYDSLKEGDLVFFRTVSSRISHVGVYITNNFFVHSCSSKGVTVSSLDDKYWSRTYAGAGRIM